MGGADEFDRQRGRRSLRRRHFLLSHSCLSFLSSFSSPSLPYPDPSHPHYRSTIDIPELLDITFSTLDTQDLLACALVSRLWHRLSLPHLWRDADMVDCNGMWPCYHRLDVLNDTTLITPFLEKYGRFIWHMSWPLQWVDLFVRMGNCSTLKTLRTNAFSFGQAPLGQIEPFLQDTPAEAFEDLQTMNVRVQEAEYDQGLFVTRTIWHLILNSPSLQRIELDHNSTRIPGLNFLHRGTGPTPFTVMISPGGQFLKRVFENLPQLRHLKLHLHISSPCFLVVLARVSDRLHSTKSVAKIKGSLSLELYALELQQFLNHENRVEEALCNLVNYNIRSLDVQHMSLEEMDTLMTITPALEKLHVRNIVSTQVLEKFYSFLDSESWVPSLRHNSLMTMRLVPRVMGLLASHVIWDKLERFEAPSQRLLWGLGLLLERMPNVQHVEITCSLHEHKPKARVLRQLKEREATGIQSPLSVRSLIVHTLQSRRHSAMLTLLPRLPFLTRLELFVKRAPVLEVIARSCPELEHLKLNCEETGHRELHLILATCSKLKTVRTTGLEVRAIDLIQKPVVCLGLQELEVTIKGIPRLTIEQARALGFFRYSSDEVRKKEFQRAFRRQQRSFEIERQVMAQLARLTDLRVLILSKKKMSDFQSSDCSHSSLALTIESGICLLEPLRALHTFEFERISHKMGLRELQWISDHCPSIATVRGNIHTRFGPLCCNSPTVLPRMVFRGRARGRRRGCCWGRGRG